MRNAAVIDGMIHDYELGTVTRATFEVRKLNKITGHTIDDKLASLAEILDHSWFRTRLRARTPDGDRQHLKERRSARGVRLAVYWYHRSMR